MFDGGGYVERVNELEVAARPDLQSAVDDCI